MVAELGFTLSQAMLLFVLADAVKVVAGPVVLIVTCWVADDTDPGGKLNVRLLGAADSGELPDELKFRVTWTLTVPALVVTLTNPPCVPLDRPVAFTETTSV